MQIKSIRHWAWVSLVASVLALSGARAANQEVFSANLVGDNEVPPNNTAATGTFRMQIDNSTSTPTINFTLTYANLSSTPTASHLHFAQFNVPGGIMIFLCGGGGQPSCPTSTSGTITGTIIATNVTGPTAQGINAGDLAAALEAVQDGESYANLHSTKFPGGEIRGQLRRGDRKDRD
jgi:hypothetical protein